VLCDALLVVTFDALDEGILSVWDARAHTIFHDLDQSHWEGLAFLVGAAEHGAQPLDFVVWHGIYLRRAVPLDAAAGAGLPGFPSARS
jgi:hypothetical protein